MGIIAQYSAITLKSNSLNYPIKRLWVNRLDYKTGYVLITPRNTTTIRCGDYLRETDGKCSLKQIELRNKQM